ncbi:tyrosine-protein phosphatase non-receptor type 4-like isoform X4 [Ptychodera flava]|uniref:tyrosine-protein phosphatase non-receptor type 4-like isoform X4 n=1 Tax=Ptychodera flava TaxID=63121 RepID=UPI003969CB8B
MAEGNEDDSQCSSDNETDSAVIMSRRFRASSGTYNVRATELARDKQEKKIRCQVIFLDDSEQTFEVERRAKGDALLDAIFKFLDLLERDYFGLKFADADNDIDNMRWLDPLKSIRKQVKSAPYYFYFRVKFFVSDPSKLQEEYTRYQYVLQLKKDILEGRLLCSYHTGALLASYSVQAETGDYDPEEHKPGYLVDMRFIPNQTEDFEKEVAELHKKHVGQTPADAEYNYLDKAKRLEMYGVDLHYARVRISTDMDVLLEILGLGSRALLNVDFADQSNIEIQLGVTSAGLVVFQNNMKINTFSWAKIVKISFKRRQFFIQLRRELSDTREHVIGFNMGSYRSCKNLWKSCVEHHTFFRLTEPKPSNKRKMLFQLGSKFRFSGRTEYQTVEESKRRIANRDRDFSRSPSKRFARRTIASVHDIGREDSNGQPFRGAYLKPLSQNHKSMYSSFDGRIPPTTSPKRAWSDGHRSDDENGFAKSDDVFSPTVPAKMLYMDEGGSSYSFTEKTYELPAYESVPNGMSTPSDNLVLIRMKPDDQGRFGFNVKGGADQKMPVIVSRVAPNTPADLCIPRLNEGDQLLMINGKDISQFTHEQVINFIRSKRETKTGDLVLTVRPNVYVGDEEEEPAFQYIPDTPTIANRVPESDILRESILLLKESLESGAGLAQFDQLFRKKPGMTMIACRKPENIAKNRYRDVSPYDTTRVLLQGEEGDFINANYVNMDIPKSGIVNRYIAAQGPLPNTVGDFWRMAWQEQATLIVMLTTKVERGRVKCHQYWPELGQVMTLGSLEVTCSLCEETAIFANREFTVTNLNTQEKRHVLQMQYIAWPDHGVPDDPRDFLDFVIKVRKNREGMSSSTIVHCSAGIGRTGVLITMETAMCLIESNEPVYPLDIVRAMREQRAMLIQTPAQYKFVCEAIVRVYDEGIVRPLEEFRH